MKKTAIWLVSVLMLCLMTATAFAANPEKIQKERTEIEELSTKALQNLYEKVPSAEKVIGNCYAYATLSNTGMKLGIFGDAHGRGVAVNNETGERVYMRMKEMGIGFGLGIKEYDLIFVIGTEEAWKSFISGDVKFASSAEAAASDGQAGGAIEGASISANGIWVYQMTKKGLALDASIKGTKIYADKKLNTYEK
ncbi:MAG: hypothetical protein IJT01_09855 [Selenomonadaceae bacterium]|nr:hypothetical protein [Selenomonadaceae bacterium]